MTTADKYSHYRHTTDFWELSYDYIIIYDSSDFWGSDRDYDMNMIFTIYNHYSHTTDLWEQSYGYKSRITPVQELTFENQNVSMIWL